METKPLFHKRMYPFYFDSFEFEFEDRNSLSHIFKLACTVVSKLRAQALENIVMKARENHEKLNTQSQLTVFDKTSIPP